MKLTEILAQNWIASKMPKELLNRKRAKVMKGIAILVLLNG